MNISKMFVELSSVALVVAGIGTASYAKADDAAKASSPKSVEVKDEIKEKAVLFKIHDVVPIKNSDNEVVGCDYNTTFYNRTDMMIKGASLNLTWDDTAIADVIEQEKKEDSKQNKRSMGRSRSTTERITDKSVTGLVEVPSMKPLKQVMVQSRVNSDRCFLLIDNPKFDVSNCSAETPQGRSVDASRGRGSSGCAGLFQFVSAEDPQYYLEFKAITVDQEQEEREAQRAKERAVTDDLYNKSVGAIDATGTIISSIK